MKTLLILFMVLGFSLVSAQTPTSKQAAVDPEKVVRVHRLELEKKELELELQELLIKFTPGYSKVREVNARIAAINVELIPLQLATVPKAKSISAESAATIAEIYSLRASLRLCGLTETSCGPDVKQRLAELYTRAAAQPEAGIALIADAIERFDGNRENAKSAAEVSQIADEQNAELMRLLIAQNQRIVQLLEQLLKKR